MTTDVWWTFVRQAAATLWRTRRLYVATTVVVALCLILVGVALLGRANLVAVSQLARSRAEVTAYLQPQISRAQVAQDLQALRTTVGVNGVTYVDAATALQQMRVVLGPNRALLAQLDGENPFSPYFAISVDPARAESVVRTAGHLPGVSWVQNNLTVLRRLTTLINVAQGVGWALVAMAAVIAVAVTSHVTRLSMWSRRQEMATLRWLGASSTFVAAPFVLEGLMVALCSAAVATVALWLILTRLGGLLASLLPFIPWRLGGGVFWTAASATWATAFGCSLLGTVIAVWPANASPDGG